MGPDQKTNLVDRPTQLICISDIYNCQQTNTKDITGQSASKKGDFATPESYFYKNKTMFI